MTMRRESTERAGEDQFLMLVVIVDRDKTQKTVDCMTGQGVFSTFTMLARGTASSDVLNLLGLGDSKKDVILSSLRADSAESLLQKLIQERKLDEPGRGIAFTVPLTSVLYKRGFSDLGDFPTSSEEEEETKMDELHYQYDLILAVTNNGYTDQVMDAAKSVRSSGGTIVKGRETGLKEGGKFFGVAIQPEKEIVMILTPKEFREPIMKAIQEKAGPHSKAGTFAVTLPVRDTAGLSAELK